MVGIKKPFGAWEQLFWSQPPFPAQPAAAPGCSRAGAAPGRVSRSPPGLGEGRAADGCPSEVQGETVPVQDLARKPVQAGAAKLGRERLAKQLGFPAALSRGWLDRAWPHYGSRREWPGCQPGLLDQAVNRVSLTRLSTGSP